MMIRSVVFATLILASGLASAKGKLKLEETVVVSQATEELAVEAPKGVAQKDVAPKAEAAQATEATPQATIGEVTEAEAAAAPAATSSEADIAVVEPAEEKAAAPVAKAETEIPVNLEGKQSTAAGDHALRDLALSGAIIVGLGALGFLALRKYKFKNVKTSQFQMKILAQHHLGPKKSLAVVRVAGESILIGVTDHHVSMIKSLSLLDEDLPQDLIEEERNAQIAPASFTGMLSQQTKKQDTVAIAQASRVTPNSMLAEQDEEFTISQIRDVVSRQVRNLKTLE